MRTFTHFMLGVLLLVLVGESSLQAQESIREIFGKMLTAVKDAKQVEYKFIQKERMRKGWNITEVDIKLNVNPLKVYVKCIDPDEGAELLFVEGMYNGNAYVNPNGFPYFNLKLSHTGPLLLGDKMHHTLEDTGFGMFYDVIKYYLNHPHFDVDAIVRYDGIKDFKGRSCYHFEVYDPAYTTETYTVQKGESILQIARRKKIADYKILELNPSLGNYFSAKVGQEILIPTSYVPEATLYIDTETYMPVMADLRDEHGLYEHYEFLNIRINPGFAPDEFSDTFSEYGF